jgi:hypothetical protein
MGQSDASGGPLPKVLYLRLRSARWFEVALLSTVVFAQD